MAEREVDVGIIGVGTTGLAAYRRVREHTERLVLIEGGAHGTTRVPGRLHAEQAADRRADRRPASRRCTWPSGASR